MAGHLSLPFLGIPVQMSTELNLLGCRMGDRDTEKAPATWSAQMKISDFTKDDGNPPKEFKKKSDMVRW